MVIILNETLKQIEQFHGHIGPYAVIGYRMGIIANEKLGSDPFSKKAIIYTGTTPPLSCVVDGIQISSGCTLGKGNLNVKSDGIPKAIFSKNDGSHLEIILKKAIQNEINSNVTKDNIISYSEKMFNKSDEELFEIL
jgi:formylmethanofuran dehydrogenase subunit E